MGVINATDPNRNFNEVGVALYGRFMRENRAEHDCSVTAMSPGTVRFQTTQLCDPGERVIAYLDNVGRVEGTVRQNFMDGFVIDMATTERKREKLAAQLTWLANRSDLGLAEDRRHERLVARAGTTTVELPNGERFPAKILDMSFSGIALGMGRKIELDTLVIVGSLRGRVVRTFDEGIAVEFATLQNRESLDAAFPGT